ncbi:unnamed protein product [Lactuca virosa]|uniref:Uncharacterized protein n=1 Tax=Lactuca virosa TaxID=75947 RepID=A0AAU9LNB5_9ASTR|nr:unnamed protein product [Lactuca virosa]
MNSQVTSTNTHPLTYPRQSGIPILTHGQWNQGEESSSSGGLRLFGKSAPSPNFTAKVIFSLLICSLFRPAISLALLFDPPSRSPPHSISL